MFSRFGYWLARGGATTFTILGFLYWFRVLEIFSHDQREIVITLNFLTAAVFYGIDQITTAINNLKEDTDEPEEWEDTDEPEEWEDTDEPEE